MEEQAVTEKVREIVREDIFWNNSFSDWMEAALYFGLVFLPIILVKLLSFKYCAKYFSDKDRIITYKAFILSNLSKINILLAAVVASYAGLLTLNTPERFDAIYDYVLVGSIFLQLLLWANTSVNLHAQKYLARNPNSLTAMNVFSLIAKVILASLIILVMLDQMGVNITALVAGLGIGGVAIAFSLQNILSDIFASLAIILDKPFKVGDYIAVDNFGGTVEKVGLKTTRIRNLSGELLVMANNKLLSSPIRNFRDLYERRTVEIARIEYGTPYEKLEKIPEIAREAIFSQKGTRADHVVLKQLSESSLDFEIVYFIQNHPDIPWVQVQHHVRMQLVASLEKAGISFAYPTRTVYTKTF